MENIIFNELRVGDYVVHVGIVEKREKLDALLTRNQLEIVFVATLGNRRNYNQSAFRLPDAEKIRQEKASLINVKDSFKKIIIVKDVINVSRDEDGITMMSIYDFLLKGNSLEL